jgi:hypothetical protein
MGKFVKGQSGNPRGRPPGKGPGRIVLWDYKQAVRRHCPKALQRVAECLDDKDRRIRLAAAEILLGYGYGKPTVQAEVDVNHRFVVAPQTMELEEWLANKGQPTANGWLEKQRQQARPKVSPPLELKASEKPPEATCAQSELPLATAVDPNKLN